jgi:hypothetical protein
MILGTASVSPFFPFPFPLVFFVPAASVAPP